MSEGVPNLVQPLTDNLHSVKLSAENPQTDSSETVDEYGKLLQLLDQHQLGYEEHSILSEVTNWKLSLFHIVPQSNEVAVK